MIARGTTIFLIVLGAPFAGHSTATANETDRVKNGGFEQGTDGWADFWSRDNQGQARIVTESPRSGQSCLEVDYVGGEDWSLSHLTIHDVKPGEIFELHGWARIQDEGHVTLGVILRGGNQKTLAWVFGGRTLRNKSQWHELQCRFLIPSGATAIQPRWTGASKVKAWLDDVTLKRVGTIDDVRQKQLPQKVTVENNHLSLDFRTVDGSITVQDRETKKQYHQHPGSGFAVLSAKSVGQTIQLRLLKPDDMLTISGTVSLAPDSDEFTIALDADGPMNEPLAFPPPFATDAGQFLIMPVNEGISYPVDDPTIPPMDYYLWGGHGLCMAFWGVTDTKSALLAIVETPDDARVNVPRIGDHLCLAPQWAPQKEQFGPTRRIRFVLLKEGGYVAMCKRYRKHVQDTGQFKTLASKRSENENVDRLIGAVNVWCWDQPAVETCQTLRQAGIERILWSRRSKPKEIEQLNKMGVLSSRYDIYQDAMNPADFVYLRGKHPDWTSDAWPNDLVIRHNGEWERGWQVKGKDGKFYPCGVLCDRQAIDYARKRVSEELKTHAYACRFIDTTTAAPWRECYHPDHPMTRSQSRKAKMELLRFMSETSGLVTGSETGHDAAVPYVHYFEGMLSLGPYRVPDAGRNMLKVEDDVPARVAKFQTGHYYRLPLWELVYHDCVVAQWYWGDYNNKLPSLWARRDLFNALYGTPPMFLFNRRIWKEKRDRFVQSYQIATPVARATGYVEMLTHQWLNEDHSVQQTRFANGVTVTVNLGDQSFTMPDKYELRPMSHRLEGIIAENK